MAELCHLLKMTSLPCFMNTDSNDLPVIDFTRSAACWIPNQKTKCWNEDSTGCTSGLNLIWVTQTLGLPQNGNLIRYCLTNRCAGCKVRHSFPFSLSITSHSLHPREFIVLRKKSMLQLLLTVLKKFLLRSQSPSHVFFFPDILNFLSWSSNPKQLDLMKAALSFMFIKQLRCLFWAWA